MKEVITRNEFDKSYLLINKEGVADNYVLKMLTRNHIPGILECKVRYLEEQEYLAYDITGKRTLIKEFAARKIGFSDILELFYSIHKIMHCANDYLLDYSGFWLDPKYMYTDLDTGELDCLYFPESEYNEDNIENREEKYRKFADFLLDKVDHRDENAVNIAYHFYKISKEEYFSFESFIGFLEKEQLLVQAKKQERKQKETGMERATIKEEDSKQENEELLFSRQAEDSSINWVWPIVAIILGLILIVGYFFVPFLHKYTVYVLVPGVAVFIMAVLLLVRNVIYRIKEISLFSYDEPQEPVPVEEYFDNMADDMTVFFEEEEFLKLKWKENHFSKEYVLREFPITVGKLKGSVHMAIEDTSVSRLHARFRQQGSSVYIQDLESTNGTYVNKNRLLAGEERIIKRGDEIQFGKIIVNVV